VAPSNAEELVKNNVGVLRKRYSIGGRMVVKDPRKDERKWRRTCRAQPKKRSGDPGARLLCASARRGQALLRSEKALLLLWDPPERQKMRAVA